MPSMAAFDEPPTFNEDTHSGVAHRHPGARVNRRVDKRPLRVFTEPDARKKCGHCQDLKPCVEFSADVSRGDGLRGWCKMCEAEARSNRYKKRKAAAVESSVSRRRMEQPLGGLPPYHSMAMHSGGFDRQQPQHPPPLHLQQQFGAQPHLQPGQMHQQPLHLQHHLQELQHQQQQQQYQQRQQPPALNLALLQQSMAAWQAQQAAAAAAAAEQAAAAAEPHRSAFHPVVQSRPPAKSAAAAAGQLHLQPPVQHAALPGNEALAAYLAAEAAAWGGSANGGGNGAAPVGRPAPQAPTPTVPRVLMPFGSPHGAQAAKAAAEAAKAAAQRPPSPATSDSEISAGEILTGMKHAGPAPGQQPGAHPGAGAARQGYGSPSAAESQQHSHLWRRSTSNDSAAASMPLAALRRQPDTLNPGPLPPTEQVHIPRRSRTRVPPPTKAAAASPTAANTVSKVTPPQQPPQEVTQWSSQFLALLLTMRAAAVQRGEQQ